MAGVTVRVIGFAGCLDGVDTAMNATTMTCGGGGVLLRYEVLTRRQRLSLTSAPISSIGAGLDYHQVLGRTRLRHWPCQYVPITDDITKR